MQALAFDTLGRSIRAEEAQKGKNYTCISCEAIVRRRGGDWVRDHFYHLQDSPSCHLSQKSETHLNLQIGLQEALPKGEAFLEERFRTINRIADVAWFRYQIVFEIQVSPLCFEEMLARIEDYKKIGWHLVWILHSHSFFRLRASEEELLLTDYPHYFANHSPDGVGEFFDVIWNGPYPPKVTSGVRLQHPLQKEKNGFRDRWPFYFKGDFFDLADQGLFTPQTKEKGKISLGKWFTSGYHYLLESIFD